MIATFNPSTRRLDVVTPLGVFVHRTKTRTLQPETVSVGSSYSIRTELSDEVGRYLVSLLDSSQQFIAGTIVKFSRETL